MKIITGFLALLLFTGFCRAQNLFPNPGFENYTLCPDYTSQIGRCTGWDSINGTADYYNCGYYANSTLGDYGIPRSGTGVVGLICSAPSVWNPSGYWYGEVFGATLLQPLVPGASYRLSSWWVSPTTSLPVTSLDCYDVGFYFYKSAHPPVIPLHGCSGVRPQVRIAPNQIQVSTYTSFTTDFIADSCYDRVMIGLFCNDSTLATPCMQINEMDYFDVDDISLVKLVDPPLTQSSFTASASEACAGDTITWFNTSSADRTGFFWTFDGGIPGSSAGPGPHVIAYPNAGTYSTTLIASYECSQDTISSAAPVTINEPPEIILTADTTTLCSGTPRILRAESSAPLHWSTGETGETITVKEQGLYFVRAENVCGIASDSVIIPYADCPCNVWVPSAFTPNDDTKNEIFHIYTDCVLEQFNLSIYNRFGEKVFTGNDLSGGWDGDFSGPAPSGIYVAVVRYTGWEDGKLKRHELIRKVALLR